MKIDGSDGWIDENGQYKNHTRKPLPGHLRSHRSPRTNQPDIGSHRHPSFRDDKWIVIVAAVGLVVIGCIPGRAGDTSSRLEVQK